MSGARLANSGSFASLGPRPSKLNARWNVRWRSAFLTLPHLMPAHELAAQRGWQIRFAGSGHRSESPKVRKSESPKVRKSESPQVRKSGVRSSEFGVRSPESGVRSSESGVRSPESGVRKPDEVSCGTCRLADLRTCGLADLQTFGLSDFRTFGLMGRG